MMLCAWGHVVEVRIVGAQGVCIWCVDWCVWIGLLRGAWGRVGMCAAGAKAKGLSHSMTPSSFSDERSSLYWDGLNALGWLDSDF